MIPAIKLDKMVRLEVFGLTMEQAQQKMAEFVSLRYQNHSNFPSYLPDTAGNLVRVSRKRPL